MTEQITEDAVGAVPAPIRKTLTVQAPAERAFAVFTEGFGTWWPAEHHLGTAELQEAVIEPRLGGRWYERCVDGAECDWGRVLVWEPPHRLVLSWHLGPDWVVDPDPARASEIEVRFVPAGTGTRVEFEHRHFHRHGPRGAEVRDAVSSEGGWGGILQRYAAVFDG